LTLSERQKEAEKGGVRRGQKKAEKGRQICTFKHTKSPQGAIAPTESGISSCKRGD
jgi:hypothetical protein